MSTVWACFEDDIALGPVGKVQKTQIAAHAAGLAWLESPDARTRYAVRVDVDGDGHVSRGDYVSMESYPVLTFDSPSRVTIRVRPVESRGTG
jgi:hypothetical protein